MKGMCVGDRPRILINLIKSIIVVAVLCCVGWQALAQGIERPKVGVVLSGGGARGAAHIGVLKVLEEQRIPIDYLAGTSMGAIIGGLYASGLSVDEIEVLYRSIDWQDVFEDQPSRLEKSYRRKRDDDLYLIDQKPGIRDGELQLPTGLIQGEKLELILRRATHRVSQVRHFDRLPVPFRCVATDITTGEAVVFYKGDLPTAMRSSMAVPGLFAATRAKKNQLLVDGGISNNLPVDVVRLMGADIVIAIDISSPLMSGDEIKNLISITEQLTSFLTRRNTERQIASLVATDILIVPELDDITSSDFDHGAEAIQLGVEAARKHLDQLAGLKLAPEAHQVHLAQRLTPEPKEKKSLAFIRIDSDSNLADEIILTRMQVKAGQPIDIDRIEADVRILYGLGLFELVTYQLVEEQGQMGLVIEARKKSWGPNYLQFGVALDSTLEGENSYNLAVGHIMTEMNDLGGELQTNLQVGQDPTFGLEYYQPLDYDSPYYLLPRFVFGKENINLFDNGSQVAELRLTSAELSLAFGREFSTWADLRVGVRFGQIDAKVLTGTATLPDDSFDTGEFFTSLTLDRFDDFNFPRNGLFAGASLTSSKEALGAGEEFDQLNGFFNGAHQFGAGSVLMGGEFGSTVSGTAAPQNRFRLGGFMRLSGFSQDQLTGQQYLLLRSAYLHRLKGFNLIPLYLGASLEAGNVWEDREDIDSGNLVGSGSLFIGIDSPLGPIYSGYGIAEGNQKALFFFLGRPF
jgi:NTE family protein